MSSCPEGQLPLQNYGKPTFVQPIAQGQLLGSIGKGRYGEKVGGTGPSDCGASGLRNLGRRTGDRNFNYRVVVGGIDRNSQLSSERVEDPGHEAKFGVCVIVWQSLAIVAFRSQPDGLAAAKEGRVKVKDE